ncbi:MAG: hypothetical protein AB1480_07415 [Nitrospirota bacterium]
MTAIIKRKMHKLLKGLDDDAIQYIISGTIEGVKKGVERKKIRNFGAYVSTVFKNKTADYFRGPGKYIKVSNFNKQDICDINSLLMTLRDENNKAANYVLENWLQNDTKLLIWKFSYNESVDVDKTIDCLIRDFNRILEVKNFWKPEIFSDIDIPQDKSLELHENKSTAEEIRKQNKTLLTNIFPMISNEWAGKIAYISLHEIYDASEPKLHTKPEIEKEIYINEILQILEQISIEDDNFCAKLLRYWYFGLKEGLQIKEMAERIGYIPNTFTIRIRQCGESIYKKYKKLFEGSR